MVAIGPQLDAARELGAISLELLRIGATPATVDCPRDEDGQFILEEDEGYWRTLLQMKSILTDYGEPEVTDPGLGTTDEIFESARTITVERSLDDTVGWELEIIYYAYGSASITGRIVVDDVEKTVLDFPINPPEEGSYELTEVDIGRLVARAELELLAAELGSAAATMDYWMVEGFPQGIHLSQTQWADIRGVSRQAVSENVNDAKAQLETN